MPYDLLSAEVARRSASDEDDSMLVDQLRTTPDRAEAWARLLAVADEFAGRPHAENDCRWNQPEERPDGVIVVGFPVYGERVERACGLLYEVGAVTPAYEWMRHTPPELPEDGAPLAPADAIRLATATLRSERFGDGMIAKALEDGTFQAVLASLAAWYRSRP